MIGALIGKQTGRDIEIMNSFELLVEKKDGEMLVNQRFYHLKEEQCKFEIFTQDWIKKVLAVKKKT